MKLLVFLSLCSVTLAVQYEMPEQWNLWKSQHGKTYKSDKEDLERHLNWVSNKKYIDLHNANADVFGFTLAMNHFGDLSLAEFMEQHGGSYQMDTESSRKANTKSHYDHRVSYPDAIDWRTRNAVTAIKNQGVCGSSYAFGTLGALEGASALATGNLVRLSEQNIIDCSVPYSNHGCRGGNMHNSARYIINNDGVDVEESYKYKEYQTPCEYNTNNKGATASRIIDIKSGDEKDLMAALATIGPMSVAVDTSDRFFMFYSEGVYQSSSCSSSVLTHAMVAIGYGTYDNKPYWLVKNSWGKHWGMNGFIMMSKDRYNQCGIASDASYLVM